MNVLHKIIFVFSVFLFGNVHAEEYSLSIQPILSKDKIITAYQPLADYLTAKTGHTIVIKTYRNFFTYWQKMKRDDSFDLVLDAAHFTDYRIQNNGYTVLVKIPETVSFSLVTHEDFFVFEPEELILKYVATMPSPGLGGIRLYEIFDDPSRLPREVTVHNSNDAVAAIMEGHADAAIIPSPLVGNYDYLNTVLTTESAPHMGLSASPNVPLEVNNRIIKALVNANNTADGKLMLEKVGLSEFVETTKDEYSGYSELLKDVFGYTPSLISTANN